MSASCIDVWAGLLVTLVANGALLYGGHLASRRFWPEAMASTRLAAAVTVWVALVVVIFYPLALAGALTRWAALAASVAVGLACHAAWGRGRAVGAEARAFLGWFRAIQGSRGALFLAGVGLLLVSAVYRAALWPPLSFDSLSYHDYLAGSWVQAGGFTRFSMPQGMEGFAYLPHHFEALVAWTMLPFHSDFLINFVNFPLLALGAVCVYALCREFDLDVHDSSLAAGLVCVSPAVLAYVCTQYNDILVMSLLLCGALFLVRHVRHGGWPDAVMAFMAAGLAVGTKHTAIPGAAIVCLGVVLSAARPRDGRRRGTAALAVCVAVTVFFGGYRYIRNCAEVGNPVYPATIRILGSDLFPQAPVITAVAAQMGHGSWRDDVNQLGTSLAYVFGTRPTPLVWGPKLPTLVLLALLAIVLSMRSPRRAELRWLALCWVVPTLLFYLDASANTAAIRRFWPEAFCRFLAAPVGLMAVSGLAAVSLLRREGLRRVVRGGLAAFLLYDMLAMCVLPDSPRILAIAGCAVALCLGVALAMPWPMRGRLAIGAGLLAVLVGAYGVSLARDHWRNRFLESRTELHDIPRNWARGWAFCDEPQAPKAIALMSYEPNTGHHWFFYPLMGRRLQNRVLYVPTTRDARQADFGVWSANLRQAGVSHIFVQLHPTLPLDAPGREPVEMGWIRARPDVFTLLDQGDYYRVYKVAPPPSS